MTKLQLKQIAGPVSGGRTHGASIVFEPGVRPKWTADIHTALLLPNGTTAQRPDSTAVTNGHLRYNSTTNRMEAYINGAWVDVAPMVGATSSVNGNGGMVPAPVAGQNGMFLRGDGAWANPNLGFKMYQFKVFFDASGNIAKNTGGGSTNAQITEMQMWGETWGYNRVSTSQLTVTHNKGMLPIMTLGWGFNTTNGYVQKIPTGNPTAAFSVAHDTSSFNYFNIYGLTAGNTNASGSQHVLWQVFFAL